MPVRDAGPPCRRDHVRRADSLVNQRGGARLVDPQGRGVGDDRLVRLLGVRLVRWEKPSLDPDWQTNFATAWGVRPDRVFEVNELGTFLGIRSNVWASFAAIVLGIVIILVQRRRHTGDEASPYVPGREWQGPDAEVESESESDSDSLDDGVEGENITDETAATSSSRSPSP